MKLLIRMQQMLIEMRTVMRQPAHWRVSEDVHLALVEWMTNDGQGMHIPPGTAIDSVGGVDVVIDSDLPPNSIILEALA